MSPIPPRARALLRQASQTAAANKRTAAEQLYRQIIDEFPQVAEGWIGLAEVSSELTDKRSAYEQALRVEPDHETAIQALSDLDNGLEPALVVTLAPPLPTPGGPKPVAESPTTTLPPAPTPFTSQPAAAPIPEPDEELVLFCSTHPGVRTNLRCYSCGKLICSRCARHTPVGWRCSTCIYEAQEVFFNAEPIHYVLAFVGSAVLGGIGGFIVPFIGWFTIFLAAGMGTLIGRAAFRLTGKRRGRYLPHIVAAAVVVGGLLPAVLSFLLALFGLAFLDNFGLIWPIIYVALAAGSAFYQVR